MANVLAALVERSGHAPGRRPVVTLSLVGHEGRVRWRVSSRNGADRRLGEQLLNAYLGSSLTPLQTTETTIPDGYSCWTQNVRLSPSMAPLRAMTDCIDPSTREFTDPITALVTTIQSGRRGRVQASIELSLQAVSASTLRRARRLARWIEPGHDLRQTLVQYAESERLSWRLASRLLLSMSPQQDEPPPEIAAKLRVPLFNAHFRLNVIAPHDAELVAQQKLSSLLNALAPFMTGSGQFIGGAIRRANRGREPGQQSERSFLLTGQEAALLWHPPTLRLAAPRLDRARMHELPPPPVFSSPGEPGHAATLGRVCFRADRRKLGIDLDARRRHCILTGKTGAGKSTLLLNLVADDLAAGRGVTLIDPHGDLAESALACISSSRTNGTVVFDAGDSSHAVSFNPLTVADGADPTLVADGVLSAFQKVFALEEGSAPRLLYIFRNCLLTLVGQPGATLLSVQRLLVDDRYREPLVRRVMNPVVKQFWLEEFDRWKPSDRTAFVASLQNKLGAFTANQRLQRILGQPENRIDLGLIMNAGQPLIVNLSKGRVGENAGNLLGALLVSSLQLTAMGRSTIPENDRLDHSIIIDEFQNYATPSIATFLSESRKMRVHTILANQYLGQLDESIRDAVIGNVGSMVAFQLGADDAEFYAKQLGGSIKPEHFMNLPKYHAYARLLIDGVPSPPFSMSTLPPQRRSPRRAEVVHRVSRQRYARPVKEVDRQISHQLGATNPVI